MRGAAEFERHVTTDKPVSLSMKELSEDRRVEVRSFVARCAAYLGEFEPFVTALNDPGQKLAWTSQIETLKAAMVRGPDTAQKVLLAFEKHRGADAPALFRMLWGYTPEQLAGGEAATLVEYLNHDSLDFRVLAFNNLREITGKGLNYQPQNSGSQAAQGISELEGPAQRRQDRSGRHCGTPGSQHRSQSAARPRPSQARSVAQGGRI